MNRKLLLIVVGALALRLIALQFVQHPGIGDPNHYYNLGLRLVEGHGFTTDYIWMYSLPPESLVHPEDHWMPLTAVIAAVPMALSGAGVYTALIPFLLLGALLTVVVYLAARQFNLSESASLFSAAAAGALPEFVLNSVRTDTTIPYAILVCGSILLLNRGLRRVEWWAFIASGIAGGLAYLTRNDGLLLLPMLVVTLLVYALGGRGQISPRWRYAVLMPIAAVVVAAPWIVRNIQVIGTPTTPESRDMFFFTEQRDHYAYARDFTLETMLARQTPAEILSKRLFELAAAIKLTYTTLDIVLPVAVAGGLLLLLAARDRERWLTLAPTLILLLGFLIAYPLLIPYKSQSGSFKKAYLTLIPLLLPLAGYGFERAITESRIRAGAMALTVAFLSLNAIELVRADARFTQLHMTRLGAAAQIAQTLPDTNGDGQIVLMAQDPFMLRYLGLSSVMIPNEDRETVLYVADRYGVDYLLMPPDRDALDPIYTGAETDERFRLAARVPGTDYALYGLDMSAVEQSS